MGQGLPLLWVLNTTRHITRVLQVGNLLCIFGIVGEAPPEASVCHSWGLCCPPRPEEPAGCSARLGRVASTGCSACPRAVAVHGFLRLKQNPAFSIECCNWWPPLHNKRNFRVTLRIPFLMWQSKWHIKYAYLVLHLENRTPHLYPAATVLQTT